MLERLQQIRDYYNLPQQLFAQKLELSPSTISSIFTGRTKPGNNLVQAIHRAFPEINIVWLMFGEGEIQRNPRLMQIQVLSKIKYRPPFLTLWKGATPHLRQILLPSFLMQQWGGRKAWQGEEWQNQRFYRRKCSWRCFPSWPMRSNLTSLSEK